MMKKLTQIDCQRNIFNYGNQIWQQFVAKINYARWGHMCLIPENFKSTLPTVEEIEEELTKKNQD